MLLPIHHPLFYVGFLIFTQRHNKAQDSKYIVYNIISNPCVYLADTLQIAQHRLLTLQHNISLSKAQHNIIHILSCSVNSGVYCIG